MTVDNQKKLQTVILTRQAPNKQLTDKGIFGQTSNYCKDIITNIIISISYHEPHWIVVFSNRSILFALSSLDMEIA